MYLSSFHLNLWCASSDVICICNNTVTYQSIAEYFIYDITISCYSFVSNYICVFRSIHCKFYISCRSWSPKKSPVWDYFMFDQTNGKCICQIIVNDVSEATEETCGHSLHGKFPTNLKQHLKRVHPKEYDKLVKKEKEKRKNIPGSSRDKVDR